MKQSPRLQYRGVRLHTLLFKKELLNIYHTGTGYITFDARIALTEFQGVVLDYRECHGSLLLAMQRERLFQCAILSMRLI